jgi:hypothetical protein
LKRKPKKIENDTMVCYERITSWKCVYSTKVKCYETKALKVHDKNVMKLKALKVHDKFELKRKIAEWRYAN